MTRAAPERTPLTDPERRVCQALRHCTYFPGSWDKRFARQLGEIADEADGGLTEKQRAQLHRMARAYRGQLGYEWERWCIVLYGVSA